MWLCDIYDEKMALLILNSLRPIFFCLSLVTLLTIDFI